ncbi:MAG: hypothetical protein IKE73_01450 [Bacilli bacterium]|nr:hypothetical protein [Bacilli bacterium]
MKEEAKSYEEIIRKKRCIELTRYYNLTEEVLEKIYNFLKENNKGLVKGNKQSITLIIGNDVKNAEIINTPCISSSIDGIIIGNDVFKIIPHYVPPTRSYSGFGGSSGGGSSNNNNNNNR